MLTPVSRSATILRGARTSAGLSIRALAETAQVSPSTISRIESGSMEPTLSMLERLLAAAGFGLDVVLQTRTGLQVADLVDAWSPSPQGEVIDWTRLRAFLDYLDSDPEVTSRALAQMPRASGSELLDNVLAGMAETVADRAGIERPAWTPQVQSLRKPWASPGTPRMQALARAKTPPALTARGLTLSETSLWRERADVR